MSPDRDETDAEVRSRIRAERREREVAQRARARRLNAPARPPEPSPARKAAERDLDRCVEALGEVSAAMAQAMTRGATAKALRRRRASLEVMRRHIERRLHDLITAEGEAHWRGYAIPETTDLAMARGEEVVETPTEVSDWARDQHGGMLRERGEPILVTEQARAPRVLSRVGLTQAWARGALDGGPVGGDQLHEVGKRYRRAYERANRMRTRDRDAPVTGDPPRDDRQSIVAQAMDELQAMRSGQTARAVRVMDLVCGQDMAITAAARLLQCHRVTAAKVLREALTRAGEALLWR